MLNEAQKQGLIEEFMEEVEGIAKETDDGSLPLEDLIQEGYVGLISAVQALGAEAEEEETAEGGLFLSQMLRERIRGAMLDAQAAHRNLLKDDDRLIVQVELLNRSIERLTEELGTKPNIDEIANDMKITQEDVLSILKLTGDHVDEEALRPPVRS